MAKTRVRRTSRWLVALPAALGGTALGFLFGAVAIAFSGLMGGNPPTWTPLAVAAAMGGTAWLIRAIVIEGSGDLARRIFMGADQGTTPEYSVARSHQVAGRHEAALAAYMVGAEAYPDDPTPLIEGARVLRQELGRPEEAVALLGQARAIPQLDQRDENLIDQEMVDLFTGPLDQPHRALPILARMAEIRAGTRPGEWAGRRLARLRTHLWEQVGPDTAAPPSRYHRDVTGHHEDPQARSRPGGRTDQGELSTDG
jgi:hypothetical protein